jgi:hypothetical protein
MLFIDRLAKVANDPIVQGEHSVNIIGIGSRDDCRTGPPASIMGSRLKSAHELIELAHK